jgi:hypothetical protein
MQGRKLMLDCLEDMCEELEESACSLADSVSEILFLLESNYLGRSYFSCNSEAEDNKGRERPDTPTPVASVTRNQPLL